MAPENIQCNICFANVEKESCFHLMCSHSMCNRCVKSISSIHETVICGSCFVISPIRQDDQTQKLGSLSGLTKSSIFSEKSSTQMPRMGHSVVNSSLSMQQVLTDSLKINEEKNPVEDKNLSENKLIEEEESLIKTIQSLKLANDVVVIEEQQIALQAILNFKDISNENDRNFLPKQIDESTPTFQAKIITACNPNHVYVQVMDKDAQLLSILNKELQVYISGNGTKTNSPKIIQGSPCAVFSLGKWHRAVVEMTPPNSVRYGVFCIDTGHRVSVKQRHIRQLPSRFMELPAQAVRCKLDCLVPLMLRQRGSMTFRGKILPTITSHFYWPFEILDLVIQRENRIAEISVKKSFMGRVGSSCDTEESWLMTNIYLEGESTTLNQQVNDTFLKILGTKDHPYNSLFATRNLKKKSTAALHGNQAEDAKKTCARSRNMKTAAKRKVKPQQKTASTVSESIYVTVKQMSGFVEKQGSSVASTVREVSLSPSFPPSPQAYQLTPKEKQTHAKFWDFPEPETTLTPRFKGVVTWIDSQGNVYVHSDKCSKQLIVIREKLNATFSLTEASTNDLQCTTGDPCIAKYKGNWYRAMVKDVSLPSLPKKIVTVFLVDYGFTGFVDPCDIRRDLIFTKIPVQTFRCSLHNLKPMSNTPNQDQMSWPTDVVNFLHEVTVNQPFHVNVYAYSPLEASLKFYSNGMDLTDFLVAARKGNYVTRPSIELA